MKTNGIVSNTVPRTLYKGGSIVRCVTAPVLFLCMCRFATEGLSVALKRVRSESSTPKNKWHFES